MYNNNTTITKHLLGFEITKVNNHDLRKMYRQADFDEYANEIIPRFVVDNDGFIRFRDDFIDEKIVEDDLNTTYFNLISFRTIDEHLEIEYSNDGLDETLFKINFNELIDKLKISELEKIKQMNYLVIESTTCGSYDHWSGGYEYDTENSVIGYLNNDLELVKIN